LVARNLVPKFDPQDYIEVKDRIVLFWEKYPGGAIVTELVHVDDHCVRMKAMVYEHRNVDHTSIQVPLGVGHAEEYRITEADIKKDYKKQYEPNATSAVENCETSAVGRALAMAGFDVSKSVASRQEMEKVQRQQTKRENSQSALDKPKEPATVTASSKSGNGLAGTSDKLDADEARTLAGSIKGTGIEMTAVELKLVAMGIEKSKTLSETLRAMSKEQAQDLYSWVMGNQN
jgi:hypothetical protein